MKENLSKRERQIMDSVYRRSRASAEEVREDLSGEVSNSAVRTTLAILEDKGFLSHEPDGKRYVYFPTVPAKEAGMAALRNVVKTFFENSATDTVAALIADSDGTLSAEDYERLRALIDAAPKEGGEP